MQETAAQTANTIEGAEDVAVETLSETPTITETETAELGETLSESVEKTQEKKKEPFLERLNAFFDKNYAMLMTWMIVLGLYFFMSWVYKVYPFSKKYTAASYDYSAQICPFFEHMFDFLKGKSSLTYSYAIMGGADVTGMFLYTFVSPFSVLFLVCGEGNVVYTAAYVVGFKLATVGLAGAWFARKLFKNIPEYLCVVIGLLYAFCGYAFVASTFIAWLDLLIYLPFCVGAFCHFVKTDNFWPFAVLVACCIYTHFSIASFALLTVFPALIAYALFCVEKERRYKFMARLCLAFGMAVIIALPILVPALIAFLRSSRAGGLFDNVWFGFNTETWEFDNTKGYLNRYEEFFFKKFSYIIADAAFVGLTIAWFFRNGLKTPMAKFMLTAGILTLLPVVVDESMLLLNMGSYLSYSLRFGFLNVLYFMGGACLCLNELCHEEDRAYDGGLLCADESEVGIGDEPNAESITTKALEETETEQSPVPVSQTIKNETPEKEDLRKIAIKAEYVSIICVIVGLLNLFLLAFPYMKIDATAVVVDFEKSYSGYRLLGEFDDVSGVTISCLIIALLLVSVFLLVWGFVTLFSEKSFSEKSSLSNTILGGVGLFAYSILNILLYIEVKVFASKNKYEYEKAGYRASIDYNVASALVVALLIAIVLLSAIVVFIVFLRKGHLETEQSPIPVSQTIKNETPEKAGAVAKSSAVKMHFWRKVTIVVGALAIAAMALLAFFSWFVNSETPSGNKFYEKYKHLDIINSLRNVPGSYAHSLGGADLIMVPFFIVCALLLFGGWLISSKKISVRIMSQILAVLLSIQTVFSCGLMVEGNRSDQHHALEDYKYLSSVISEQDDSGYYRTQDLGRLYYSNDNIRTQNVWSDCVSLPGGTNAFSVFSSIIDADNYATRNLFAYQGGSAGFKGQHSYQWSYRSDYFASCFMGYKYIYIPNNTPENKEELWTVKVFEEKYGITTKGDKLPREYMSKVMVDGEHLHSSNWRFAYKNNAVFPLGYRVSGEPYKFVKEDIENNPFNRRDNLDALYKLLRGKPLASSQKGDQYSGEYISLEAVWELSEYLHKEKAADVKVGAGEITAKTTAEKDGEYLLLNFVASKGYNVTVNGKKAKLVDNDLKFLMVELEEGENVVHFTYSSPYVKYAGASLLVSLMAVALVLLLLKKTKILDKCAPVIAWTGIALGVALVAFFMIFPTGIFAAKLVGILRLKL